MKVFFGFLAAFVLTACSGGGGGGGSGALTSSNKFSASGTPITIDDIVSASKASAPASTSATYYGRVLVSDSGTLYGASIHFTLNKHDATTAYFSDFYVDRLAQLTGYDSATGLITTPSDLGVSGVYNALTNSISIANASSRFVSFNVDFGDNTHFDDISNAGVVFSSDFSTMVGGNNLNFFFIAQKASSMPSVSATDIKTSWNLANFTVSGGTILFTSTSSVTVGGTGGHGLIAFSGSDSLGTSFGGETSLADAGTGIFVFGFDSTPTGTPSADGTLDGVFLLSPDKSYVLGYDDMNGNYFAASK